MNKVLPLMLLSVLMGGLAPPALAQSPALPSFREFDRNLDRAISLTEVRRYSDDRAREMDGNGNRRLDAEELASAISGMNVRQAANYIDLMDRDGDDELSFEEVARDLPMLFRMADTDGDGQVSPSEYDAFTAKLRSEGG